MEDVKQDLGANPISPPVEEAGEPLDVAKLVHTASRLEAHADALVVGVRVDLVAGHAAAEEPRAVEVDPITQGECCVQRVPAGTGEHRIDPIISRVHAAEEVALPLLAKPTVVVIASHRAACGAYRVP